MKCQHCYANQTTHPSGYCKPCRVWVASMEAENASELRRQDALYVCNGCSAEFESAAQPSQCPECQRADIESWSQRLESALVER